MRSFQGIPDLQQAVGTHLGYSAWRTITQQRIDTFADATDDHQWIHVDPERAAEGPFGRTIAHGYLTLSLLSGLVGEVYRVQGLAMVINYGLNKVRFPAPVPVGSRVRAGVELLSLQSLPRGVQTTTRVTVEIDGSDRPGCVAESLALLVPAPDD